MADHQIQQQHALAALQEQQRLRHIAMVEEQERQQQALAILHQARLREEERLRQQEQEHIDLDPEHRPLNAAMAQRIFQGWQQQHEADLEEDFNDLGPQNDIPSEDDLEYVDPAGHQAPEQLDPPLDNPLGPQDDIPSDDDLEYVDPAGHQPAEQMDPPLDVPLGPQDDISSDDDLEYVDPAEHQPAEQMDPPLDVPLGPQDDIPSDDDLEYVDPVQQRHAEDWDPAPPNHLAGLQNPAEQPPLELPIPPQLGPIQPVPRGRQPYLIEYPPHYLGPMTVICPHCQALHFDAEKLTKSTIYNPKFG
ncbi:hypothetical protein C0989_010285, partial [Termitomyces sp. Mn162]